MPEKKHAAITFTYEQTEEGYAAKITNLKHVVKTADGWIVDPDIPVSPVDLERLLATWYALTPEQFSNLKIPASEAEDL